LGPSANAGEKTENQGEFDHADGQPKLARWILEAPSAWILQAVDFLREFKATRDRKIGPPMK
jgi:hypothetical protein